MRLWQTTTKNKCFEKMLQHLLCSVLVYSTGKYCTNFVNVYKFCQFFCLQYKFTLQLSTMYT